MNKAVTDLKAEAEVGDPLDPLARLRAPFAPHQISKLPKPFKKDAPKGKCAECGGYHGLPAVHLDYVGHAALTDRLLDVDPLWSWEPVTFAADGLPAFDRNGGLWIRLTVCGVTRLGYGNADGKSGGDAVKEIIGDALRNAAMRFGAALDLWHKGDLHADTEDEKPAPTDKTKTTGGTAPQPPTLAERAHRLVTAMRAQKTEADLRKAYALASRLCADLSADAPELLATIEETYAELLNKFAPPPADDFGLGGDEIPF